MNLVLDRVPCSVLAPLIKRWSEEYEAKHPLVRESQNSPEQYVDRRSGENESESLTILAFHAKTSARSLRRILAGGYFEKGRWIDYISFNLADKVVIACFGTDEWLNNPDLIPYYGPVSVSPAERKAGYELPVEEFAYPVAV